MPVVSQRSSSPSRASAPGARHGAGRAGDWLADDVEFEAEEGAHLGGGRRRGPRGRRRARHGRAADRLHWGDSMVEWLLDDHPDGTRFTVTEHRFADDGAVWARSSPALAVAACLA